MIAVFGSLNMDFVVRVERLPEPGETVLGTGFQTLPGGKGANQAYAAAKLGAAVRMIGAVGADATGSRLKANLQSAGVDVALVREDAALPSGVALISVDATGQNSIVVSPGANAAVSIPETQAFEGARVALFQLETPLLSVQGALRLARNAGALTILDPAPAQPLRRELLALVDILTPNESEAFTLLGKPSGPMDTNEAEALARQFEMPTVILKMGAQGCYVYREGKGRHYPGFPVDAVDTTAAGDTFNAALACALAEAQPFDHAVRFANAAAALSVTRLGAQPSAPARFQVDRLLESGTVN